MIKTSAGVGDVPDREHLEAAIWRVTRTRISRTDVMDILAAVDKYTEAEAQAQAAIAIKAERRRILFEETTPCEPGS